MVTANLLTVGQDTTDAGPWQTASIAPGANRLVVVFVCVVAPATPGSAGAVSGHGATWTKRLEDTNVRSLTVYSYVTGSNPASGPLTITPSAGAVNGCLWAVVEYAQFNPANPIPQVVMDRGNPSVIPLAAPVAGSMLTGYAFANANTDFNWSGNSGSAFSEIGGSSMTAPVTWQEVDTQPSPAATSQVTATPVLTTATSAAVVVEVTNSVIVAVSSSRQMRWNVAAFPLRSFGGGVTPGGAVRRPTMTKLLAGGGTPAGALRRALTGRRLTGGVTPSGATRKGGGYLNKKWTGAVGPTGTVGRVLTRIKGVGGSVTPAGVTRRTGIQKRLSGAAAPAGGSGYVRRKYFGGVLETMGTVAVQFFHRIYGRAGTVDIVQLQDADLELVAYLRQRVDLEVWTVADVLYDGQYSWDSSGIPSRPVARPLPPTAVDALAGFQQATVSFAPPRDDGGAPVIDYTVTASTGQTATGTESPVVVPGLVNGVAVAFTVTARNERGESQPSAPSAPVTPTGSLADPPAGVTIATGVSGQATFSWNPPANSGGQPILDYTIQLSTGATAVVTGTTHTFTGLTNGTKVSAVVSTRTSHGLSRPSNRSLELYVGTAPGAPTITSWVAGNGSATVKWAAPASNGGVPIFRYIARIYYGTSGIAEPGTAVVYAIEGGVPTGNALEHTFTGLNNGDPYQVVVTAQNDIGTGPGVRSASVTPTAPASAPITTRTATSVGTTAQTIQLTKPTGSVAGDLLIATVCHGEVDNDITPPNNWSVVDYWQFGDVKYGVWFRRLEASDASVTSWTWTITGPQAGQNTSGGIQAYVGVHPTAPFDNDVDGTQAVVNYAEIASGNTLTVAHSMAAASGVNVGCLFSESFTTGVTPPSGWTEDYERNIGGRITEQAHKAFTAPNPGVTYTWTLAGSGRAAAVVFTLRAG